jgi:hypothetical protein
MRHHFPTLYELSEKLPHSLHDAGAAIWIVVGAIIGFVLGERSMLFWVRAFINDEVAATILIPVILIGFTSFGMSLGVTLHRVRDHHRGVVPGQTTHVGVKQMDGVKPTK